VNIRIVAVAVCLLGLTHLLGWPWTFQWVGALADGWGTVTGSPQWFNPFYALYASASLLLFVLVGAALVAVGGVAHHVIAVTFAFGAISAIILLLRIQVFFGESASVGDHLWAYAPFLMGPLGTVLGGVAASALIKRSGVPPNKSLERTRDG
jgi:hypothetical protein